MRNIIRNNNRTNDGIYTEIFLQTVPFAPKNAQIVPFIFICEVKVHIGKHITWVTTLFIKRSAHPC